MPSFAATTGRRRQTVSVLVGGIAGLTATHELALRGFEVTVHEKKALGGKAPNTTVPGTGGHGRADLPGEHASRAWIQAVDAASRS